MGGLAHPQVPQVHEQNPKERRLRPHDMPVRSRAVLALWRRLRQGLFALLVYLMRSLCCAFVSSRKLRTPLTLTLHYVTKVVCMFQNGRRGHLADLFPSPSKLKYCCNNPTQWLQRCGVAVFAAPVIAVLLPCVIVGYALRSSLLALRRDFVCLHAQEHNCRNLSWCALSHCCALDHSSSLG